MDCKDPRALATFYAGLLGGTVEAEDDTWVVLTDPRGSQQFHLDVVVDNVEDAEHTPSAWCGESKSAS